MLGFLLAMMGYWCTNEFLLDFFAVVATAAIVRLAMFLFSARGYKND